MRRIVVVAAVVALAAFGCGDASAPDDATDDPAGACLVNEPTCPDTPADGAEPLDEPAGSGAGVAVTDPLTVAEALASDDGGVIAVRGFIVQSDAGIRLCEVLAESMPPQCGGASIGVGDLSTVDPDELTSAQGVTWTDRHVTIVGRLVGGTLMPE